MIRQVCGICVFLFPLAVLGGEPLDVWPGLAPGETTSNAGEPQPFRKGEEPPVTRVENITHPTLTVWLADHPNGAGVVILPGGGFGKVVTDKEGSEIAAWLNRHGVTAFVLSYRTTQPGGSLPGWRRPLQDAQRTMSLVRSRCGEWNLDPNRIGIAGFSAGGQVAARLLCDGGRKTYDRVDETDDTVHRPDFAMLIYPWNLYDSETNALIQDCVVPQNCPPTFLVHTDDDRASSLSSVLFYAELKRLGIPSELHVYGSGGHGYGLRPIPGSQISTWPDHAAHWLKSIGATAPASN
ncbi:MAG: alpha/beta hydrolase [Planctomycetaceae bacterium]